MKESIWTKKYADWTLKDGVIVAIISGLLCAVPMFVVGFYDKINRLKKR